MFFPHPPRDTYFSNVSLKTLLVLTHRRILSPSHPAAWRIVGSPNLIIASRKGLRRTSRPHRCVLQRLINNSVWAAVLTTTTLLRIVEKVFTKCRPGQVRSTSSFLLIFHDRRAIHYIQERHLLRHRPLAASADFAFLVVPSRAVAIRFRVREILSS